MGKQKTKSKSKRKTKKKQKKQHIPQPQLSTVNEINDVDAYTDPVTLDTQSKEPVVYLQDPYRIVPHKDVYPETRDAIIRNYGEEFFYGREWTAQILAKLKRAISHPKENMNRTMVQICGPLCTYKDNCPHDIVGMAPIGERCPQEKALMVLLFDAYAVAVSERLNIDVETLKDDIISHNLIMGLVEADIISMRLDGKIAKDGFTMAVPTVVNEDTGEVYYKDEEAIAVKIKERVAKRRDLIYRQLLATPEMAEKYKQKKTKDALARTTDLVERLEGVLGKVEQKHISQNDIDSDVPDKETVPG